MTDGQWSGPTFPEYEAGKKRRYELLFAVNGGAFALGQFLLQNPQFEIGRAEFAAALVVFNLAMFADIYAFGRRASFFKLVGKAVLFVLSWMLVAVWILAGGLPRLIGMAAAGFWVIVVPVALLVLLVLVEWLTPRSAQTSPS
jgi:hypothetical protein